MLRKIRQGPPGPWLPGEGGVAPFDPPALCSSGIGRESIKFAASSEATHLPSHELKVESVPSMKPEEKTRPICPQIQRGKSVCFCGTSPSRGCGLPQGERSVPLGGFQRAQPLARPLVTFPATGKSPGCRAWLCHALAERLQVGAGTTSPVKAPGARGGAPA